MLQLTQGDRDRAGKVVARAFYKILRRNGFSQGDIMGVAGYLLDGVIGEIKVNGKEKKEPVDLQDLGYSPGSKEVA
jgi:hypothetical protein